METQIIRTGYNASMLSFIALCGFGIVQIMQLLGITVYPADEILIYSFSLAIAPPFLIAVLALHYLSADDRKFWSHGALLFALLYVVYVVLMYVVQLATVIPFPEQEETNKVLLVKPHSLFWTIDALGYICMGLSTLFAAFVFKNNRREKLLMQFMVANGLVVPLISFVYFYPQFSEGLLLWASPWLVTAGGSLLLLTRFFKRAGTLKK